MHAAGNTKVESFFRQYRLKSYKRGHILVLAGDSPLFAYFLVKGRVKQYDITQHGSEIIVNIFKSGTYFMVLTALTNLPNAYYFSAETDVILYCVPVTDVITFVNTNPDAMRDMLIQAYKGYEGVLKRMTHLLSGNTRGRIIYEILLDAQGFGEMGRTGEYVLSATETELASRAGLSRETVSREVSRLKKRGLLSPTLKITVTDLALLEKALEESF